jgi:putative ABC transport system permease protein
VALAWLVGMPAGYYLMQQWLSGFAYRMELTIFIFISAGLISLAIAWLTVSIESFKAASANPVKSLRSE